MSQSPPRNCSLSGWLVSISPYRCEILQQLGIEVLITGGHHRKLAIIDRQILYKGSLNMIRFCSVSFGRRFWRPFGTIPGWSCRIQNCSSRDTSRRFSSSSSSAFSAWKRSCFSGSIAAGCSTAWGDSRYLYKCFFHRLLYSIDICKRQIVLRQDLCTSTQGVLIGRSVKCRLRCFKYRIFTLLERLNNCSA